MSRNLTALYKSFRRVMYFNSGHPVEDIFHFGFKVTIFTVGVTAHLAYTFTTSTKDKSTVIKKYKMVRNGFTDFMIIDDKGRHFNVNNSLWFWKWNSIEDWHNIKEGDQLNFKYYGWRVPFLGFFPNIYMSSKDDLLIPIKKPEIRNIQYEIIL